MRRGQVSMKKLYKYLIFLAVAFLVSDLIYKLVFDISYLKRDNCLIYKSLPRWGFLLYEYFIELTVVVLVGVFAAVLMERYFNKFGHFYPRNGLTAFLYASIIPVCSCGVIPLIDGLKGHVKLRTIITFITAAPLLNPYIISLSFSVLGVEYGIARILSAFALSYLTGVFVEWVYIRLGQPELGSYRNCDPGESCFSRENDVYLSTMMIFKKILPFLLIAAGIGLAVEFVHVPSLFKNSDFGEGFGGVLLTVVVGIPVYFCNGSDVVFLRPMVTQLGLPLGTAMAFSLTSTSVCISSLIMLVKFLGKKLTLALLVSVFTVTVIISLILNQFSG